MYLTCIFTERLCEVDKTRPVQPNSGKSQSNQDTENDSTTVNKQGSKIPCEGKRKEFSTSADDLMEISDQCLQNSKENSQMDGKLLAESEKSNRKRKQKITVKVVSLADDDDITDDETQTYSIDENFQGNGHGYEETFSQKLAMESSSPVF